MNELVPADWFAWAGIVFCLSQSAMFSGLNLALFGISRLRLEAGSASGNYHFTRHIKAVNQRLEMI